MDDPENYDFEIIEASSNYNIGVSDKLAQFDLRNEIPTAGELLGDMFRHKSKLYVRFQSTHKTTGVQRISTFKAKYKEENRNDPWMSPSFSPFYFYKKGLLEQLREKRNLIPLQ